MSETAVEMSEADRRQALADDLLWIRGEVE